MITPAFARVMAAYNRAMNDSIYAAAARLPDAERKRDLGAFFKSLHGTLNHLLLGDRLWLGRLVGTPTSFPSLGHELFSDFAALRAERAATDAEIVAYAEALTAEILARPLVYRTMLKPRNVAYGRDVALMHFFNHQTHHRGQATTLLMQLGVDPGATDLIVMPGLERPA